MMTNVPANADNVITVSAVPVVGKSNTNARSRTYTVTSFVVRPAMVPVASRSGEAP